MKFKPPEYGKLSEMAAIDVGRLTEDEARVILENIRWPEGVTCPHCGGNDVTRLNSDASKSTRDGVIQCNGCREQFTVMVGTVMQRSHITLRQWVQAFYSMCAHKKGVSASQLKRDLGLGSYQTAWHLAHRIREAMKEMPLLGALSGVVEVDETYIGGKPRKEKDAPKLKRGRGTKKTPVMLMVERQGKAVSKPIDKVNAKTLKSAIKEVVNKNSTIMTDEWASYTGIGKYFLGGHKVVNHGILEFVNGDANTNTAESYFALLKRGVHGTFHHVSKKHLLKYCDEFSFRWNNRGGSDGARAENAIKGILGKRLMYRDLVGK